MKSSLLILLFLISFNINANTDKKDNLISIKSKITKIMFVKEKIYNLVFNDYAAVYYADESLLKCLQQSMKDNKEVKVMVSPKTMFVEKCN